MPRFPSRRAALGIVLAAGFALPAAASAAVPPLDPQQVEDQQNMTFDDYKPIPGVDWATNGAVPSVRKVTIALVAFDFADQPFVITQPKKTDPFGNPQIDPVARADVPKFYADFYNTPNAINKGHTINGYWMEQSGGKVGITDIKTYGPYRMPKKLYQYGVSDIGQSGKPTGNGCPAATTVVGQHTATQTITVEDSAFFYVGDVVQFGAVSPTGNKTVTAIPDATHITVSVPVTVANGVSLQDCNFSSNQFNTDANALWNADTGCAATNCGATVHLYVYAGYDETSVWQEFGEMMFQNKEDVPHEVWGNPNPKKPNWVASRYVDWTSWFAGQQQWGESSIRQGESSGTITHEISHNIFSVGDNNNNPYVTPYHRVGSGTWDMMDRGSFNGPGGPHNRWQVPAQYGGSMGAEHTLRSKVGMGFVPNSSVLRVNRNGLAQSGLAVADVVARAVNAEPQPAGIRAGIQVFLDGANPVDKTPACDVNTNPTCDGGTWTNYSLETVQRIGYGSYGADNGVLIAKNKAWAAGANRGTEGASCGYNCFTWVEDAHPEDMNAVDYYKPDGTPIMRTIADYRQLNDALFHAGTNSGSSYEYVDGPNNLRFYVIDKYTDGRGILHYKVGIQNPTGAGPQTRGVAVASQPGDALNTCTFKLTNTGASAPTDPALHPQDETASFDSDIYKLSASASGQGWTAELRNALATAKFGESVDVPVSVARTAESAGQNTVTLTATSVSDPSKTATATCAQAQTGGTVGGSVAPTLSLSLGSAGAFGAFQPGVARDYFAMTDAKVTSTAGDALLSVADPSSTATGHLVNGTFSLPQFLQARARNAANTGTAYNNVGSSASPLNLLTWSGPVSNDAVSLDFKQTIGAGDALRTGAYSKTLTFTLSTTTP
jgi:M6 family metalloprotease-like protein